MDADLAASSALETVDDLIDRARATLSAGHPDDAYGTLTTALGTIATMPPTPAAHRRGARALGLLAMVVFETDGTEAALDALDQAAEEAAAAEDDELVALTWSLRATVLGRSGRTSESLTALDRAAVLLDALAPRDRTILLMNRGVAHAQAGDLTDGVADLRRAAALAEQHELHLEQFMATHNLGYLCHLLGDVPAALRAMEQAAALDVETSRGVSLLDRGRALLEAGLVDDADAILDEAVAVSARDGQRQAEAEARYERARAALLLGRHQEALTLLHDAAARFDERTSRAWVTRCHASELRLRIERHHLETTAGVAPRTQPEALADAGRALVTEVAHDTGVAGRAARVLAGEAAALAGELDAASELIGTDDGLGAPLLSARLDEHRARTALALARHDADAARRQLASAADELAAASLTATTLDLRTARLAHATVLARMDLTLALDAGPVAAIEAVDRWRATSSRLPPVRPDASPETAQLLTARRQLREELRDRPDAGAEGWEQLRQLDRRIASLRRAATSERAATGPGDGPAHGFVTAEHLLATLASDDRDLLVTAPLDGHVHAFGVVDGTPFHRQVGRTEDITALARRVRADLRTLSTRVLGALEPTVRASLSAATSTLATQLLGEQASTERRLLAALHGDLVGLPWSLVLPGRPVVLTASTSGWTHAHERTRSTAPATGAVDARVLRGPRLGAAALESAAVAAAWNVPEPPAPASAASLVDALATGELVHVAAHGHHHRQQPLFSSLALSDGPCCLYDVETAGVAARQVVLASCDAGSATVRPGDEPLGLAAGLLALGAQSVVAPTCAVPDELLPDVMGALHRGLAAGLATDEALLAATGGGPTAAAAFVVAGTAQRFAGPAQR